MEKTTELEDVARWEDEEASVEAFVSADFPASDVGDGGAGDEEGAGVVMTCPIIPLTKVKSGPLQHPGSSAEAASRPPQHQLNEKEPLFQGQGYRLLKLLGEAVTASARSFLEEDDLLGVGTAYHFYIPEHSSPTAK